MAAAPAVKLSTAALSAELEEALLDAVRGEPRGPLLARRAERVARAILLRAGLPSARVLAQSTAAGLEVMVLLPARGPRVQQLILRLA